MHKRNMINGMLLLHSVPTAPQNVTVDLLNDITVRLHWDPPERPNGVITGYQVTYYGYRTTVQVQQVIGYSSSSYEYSDHD